jgi:hypothetical protein
MLFAVCSSCKIVDFMVLSFIVLFSVVYNNLTNNSKPATKQSVGCSQVDFSFKILLGTPNQPIKVTEY